MSEKVKLVLKSYDPIEREIEVEEHRPGRAPIKGVSKGKTVKEFKKFVRDKIGDGVEIINEIPKNRDIYSSKGSEYSDSRTVKDDRYAMRDIRQAMKNDNDKW